jgi:D-aminopeptidase
MEELGLMETPIVLTNTLSAPTAANTLIRYTLKQEGNQDVQSVNPLVGETNDGILNNIRAQFIREEHVLQAIQAASAGDVVEGNVGAGTGTVCFGFKGGIGTASRILPHTLGEYTIGALVQTNFGGILKINGAPVGEELGKYILKEVFTREESGSCMIVLATDAPLEARQLKRLARRAFQGFVRTGGISSHGSGDYVIAFSTAHEMRCLHHSDKATRTQTILRDEKLTPLFLGAAEAVEEAIYHSLFAAKDMKGYKNQYVQALPRDAVKNILEKYNLLLMRE